MSARSAELQLSNMTVEDLALQTSPESAMKRLLCAGSGPIYQICKAFRAAEQGRNHNPEFTMLEWYRPGFSFEQMQSETLALIAACLDYHAPLNRHSYREVFLTHTGLNPHSATLAELQAYADLHIEASFSDLSRVDYLDLIMALRVEPQFDRDCLTLICDFPAEQAAMAKCVSNDHGETVARRFEVYFRGLELANGYDELDDVVELARRLGASDGHLVAALEYGLPPSCGVALGVDRLLMCVLQADTIADVLSFDFPRC